jgi:hypothetical protein
VRIPGPSCRLRSRVARASPRRHCAGPERCARRGGHRMVGLHELWWARAWPDPAAGSRKPGRRVRSRWPDRGWSGCGRVRSTSRVSGSKHISVVAVMQIETPRPARVSAAMTQQSPRQIVPPRGRPGRPRLEVGTRRSLAPPGAPRSTAPTRAGRGGPAGHRRDARLVQER